MHRAQWMTLAACVTLALGVAAEAWSAESPASKLRDEVRKTTEDLEALEIRLGSIDDRVTDEQNTVRSLRAALETGGDAAAIGAALDAASVRVLDAERDLRFVSAEVRDASERLDDLAQSAKKVDDKQLDADLKKAMSKVESLEHAVARTRHSIDRLQADIDELVDKVERILGGGIG